MPTTFSPVFRNESTLLQQHKHQGGEPSVRRPDAFNYGRKVFCPAAFDRPSIPLRKIAIFRGSGNHQSFFVSTGAQAAFLTDGVNGKDPWSTDSLGGQNAFNRAPHA